MYAGIRVAASHESMICDTAWTSPASTSGLWNSSLPSPSFLASVHEAVQYLDVLVRVGPGQIAALFNVSRGRELEGAALARRDHAILARRDLYSVLRSAGYRGRFS